MLVGSGPQTTFLLTERADYGDLDLRVEARVGPKTSAGVYARAVEPEVGAQYVPGYLAKLNVDHRDPQRTGRMYRMEAKKYRGVGTGPSPVPADQWLTMEVAVRGNRVTVRVDGQQTTDYTDDDRLFATGHVGLQFYNGPGRIELRKIELREKAEDGGRKAEGAKSWETPAFQQWVKATQALPAEQQIEAVSKKLMELNPGFDGMIAGHMAVGFPAITNGVVTHVGFFTGNVTDISPVRALVGLTSLDCLGGASGTGKLSDLLPLTGMRLTRLNCSHTLIADLSPLRGIPLIHLFINATQVSDLSPLQGMGLTDLNFAGTPVSDLSPLKGMPLTTLRCFNNPQLSDFSPLESCKSLKTLEVRVTNITPAQVAALQKALPNCKIDWDDPAKPKTPEPAASGSK